MSTIFLELLTHFERRDTKQDSNRATKKDAEHKELLGYTVQRKRIDVNRRVKGICGDVVHIRVQILAAAMTCLAAGRALYPKVREIQQRFEQAHVMQMANRQRIGRRLSAKRWQLDQNHETNCQPPNI